MLFALLALTASRNIKEEAGNKYFSPIVTEDDVLPPKGYSSSAYVFVIIVIIVVILSFTVAIVYSKIDGRKYAESQNQYNEEAVSAGVEGQEEESNNNESENVEPEV